MRLTRRVFFIITVVLLIGCALPIPEPLRLPNTLSFAAAEPIDLPAIASDPATEVGAELAAPVRRRPDLPDQASRQLQESLEAYLSQQVGTYGLYVIDLASGQGVGVNEEMAFPAASTFKVPAAMYVLDQIEQGEASLDELLAYSDEDYQEGTGILLGSIEEGDTAPIRELLELAIVYSDNVANNMLLSRFGRENVYAFMESLGATVTTWEDTAGTTPREMATYMRLLLGRRTITDPDLRRFLLDLLANTAFDGRIAAGVPDGVKVAHKIGTLPGVVNDVAIVYAPSRTFVVCILSMDVDEEPALEVIAEVSRMIYAFEHALVDVAPPEGQQALQ